MKTLLTITLLFALSLQKLQAETTPYFAKSIIKINGKTTEGFINITDINIGHRLPDDIMIPSREYDSIFLARLQEEYEIMVHEHVLTLRILLDESNDWLTAVSYFSYPEDTIFKGSELESIQVSEIISIAMEGFVIRSLLEPNDLWLDKINFESKPVKVYNLVGWWDMEDCGGEVYDYVGDPKLEQLVHELNVFENEYRLKSKDLDDTEKEKQYEEWLHRLDEILRWDNALVISSTCND
ncbi:MAG: hypothetical protein WBA74_06755 [Cyclobacteriaceae bacterium]